MGTIRNRIEAYPLQSLFIMVTLAMPVAILLSYFHADAWKKDNLQNTLEQARSDLQQQSRDIVAKVDTRFETARNLAGLLAGDTRFKALLLARDETTTQEINIYLRDFADSLKLHRAYVLDRNGVCIASNDFAYPRTLIGANFQDRDYFTRAIQGKPGTQFVVGRVSTIPGFYFSAPVRHNGEIIGVVTVKIDLETLAEQIHFTSGFVTDEMGVVVLSETPDNLLQAVADAPALSMPEDALRLRYQRGTLKMLPMIPTTVANNDAFFYGTQPHPSLLQVIRIPQDGLNVYAFQSLNSIDSINEQFLLRFYVAMLGVYCSIVVISGVGIHYVRDTYQRRKLLQLNEELRLQAQYDSLTGCYNRRKFDDVLRMELRRSSRSRDSVALVLLDLDNFKMVNDYYGHNIGDNMLMHVAKLFQHELRETDSLARIGGEEFALVLPGTNEDQAMKITGRLLARVAENPLHADDVIVLQTFSAGVVAASGETDPQDMLRQADIALYAAKKCGRNRVVRASSASKTVDTTDIDNISCPNLD